MLLVDGQSNLLTGTEDVDRAKRVLRTLEEKDLIVRLLDRTLSAPGHLRVHRRRGQPARSHRHLGGGGHLRRRGAAARDHRGHRPFAHELLQGDPLVDFTAEVITEALPKL